ncbi:MAG: TIGR00159 family protein [Chloroflexi bacterium]|nr:TIGR00159 family protein [Chloroflexota bacterium]
MLSQIILQRDLRSLFDILLVSLIFYGLLRLVRGTPALQLLRGILFLGVGTVFLLVLASNLFAFTAFNWLIRTLLPALLVAIPVIFQPELRRALERLGRGGLVIVRANPAADMLKVIRSVSRAARILSERRHGAIIVLERETGLQQYVDSGVEINGELSTELMLTIFHPKTALHDGAVIVREERILAAACALPLSQSFRLERRLGLRHRAAVGITEISDAVAIVVSEETGTVSLARHGRMIRHLDDARLSKLLQNFYKPEPLVPFPRWWPWRMGS